MSPGVFKRLTLVALVLQAAIVVTGGAVRLTGSGLGCSDWPNCEEGALVPEAGAHAWIEFGNRLFTGLLLASVAATVVGAHRLRPRRPDLRLLSWGLVAGVAAQIAIGAVVVLTELVPSAVSAHFLVSMALIADATVLHWRASQAEAASRWHEGAGQRSRRDRPPPQRRFSRAGAAVVGLAAVVLVLGTLVTGAGPHSGDREVTDRLPVDIGTIARLHATAVWVLVGATVALVVAVAVLGRRSGAGAPGRGSAPEAGGSAVQLGAAALGAMMVQGAIGYLQYFNGVPEGLVALHLVGATVVWIAVLRFHLGLVEGEWRA